MTIRYNLSQPLIFQSQYWTDVIGSSADKAELLSNMMVDLCAHGVTDGLPDLWEHIGEVGNTVVCSMLLACVDAGCDQSIHEILTTLPSERFNNLDKESLAERPALRDQLASLKAVVEHPRWSPQERKELATMAATVFSPSHNAVCVDISAYLAQWGTMEDRREMMASAVTCILKHQNHGSHDQDTIESSERVIDVLLNGYGHSEFLNLHEKTYYSQEIFAQTHFGRRMEALMTHAQLSEHVGEGRSETPKKKI